MENVIIGLSDPANAQIVQEILMHNGFYYIESCISSDEVLRACNKYDSGIVICGYKLGNTMYNEIYELMPGDYGMLVLLSSNQAYLMDSQEIFSLVLPINKADLIKTTKMILEIGKKAPTVKKTEARDKTLRRQEDKLIIEKAKIVLMNQYKITEDAAHRFIQKSSMNKGLKMVESAKIILDDD